MSLGSYHIQRILERGNFGEVLLAENTQDGKRYAIKKMIIKDSNIRKLAEQEAMLLLKLKHPNIVSYKESFVDDTECFHIITKYAPGGDLASVIEKHKMMRDILSERDVMNWSVQIFLALKYLHKRGILHRDLKPQNIFLNKNGMIKVGDLGIAKVLEARSDMATTYVGTPSYMSPELIANEPYNHKSDIWALGCCMYYMVTFCNAFEDDSMIGLEIKILYKKTPRMPFLYKKALRDLIGEMLRKHPKSRPGIKDILKNEFVKSHIRRVMLLIQDNKKVYCEKGEFDTEQLGKLPQAESTTSGQAPRGTEHLGHAVPKIFVRFAETAAKYDAQIPKEASGVPVPSTRALSGRKLRPQMPARHYNPDKYSDSTRSSSHESNHLPIPKSRNYSHDSGYRSTGDSQELGSSVRFVPVITLSSSCSNDE